MKKTLLAFITTGLIAAGLGVYFNVQRVQPQAAMSHAVDLLFSRSLPDVNGKMQPLSQWKNKTLIVNFWATWCAPCVQEMPELSILQQEMQKKGTQILGIGIDSAVNIHEFAAKYKIAFPLYVSGTEGTELSRQFGNRTGGLPFTVLISSDGKVRKTYLGKLSIRELRSDLSKL